MARTLFTSESVIEGHPDKLYDQQSPDIAQGVNQSLEARKGELSNEAIEAIGAKLAKRTNV